MSESEPEGIAMEIQPTLPDVASVVQLGVDQEALLLLSAVSPYCCYNLDVCRLVPASAIFPVIHIALTVTNGKVSDVCKSTHHM